MRPGRGRRQMIAWLAVLMATSNAAAADREVRVVARDGRAVRGARVAVMADTSIVDTARLPDGTVETDSQGTVRLDIPDRADACVIALARGYVTQVQAVRELGGAMVLEPGRDVRVEIRGRPSTPSTRLEWNHGAARFVARVDPSGSAVMQGIPRFALPVVVADDTEGVRRTIPAAVTTTTLTLPGGASVAGRVTGVDGEPVVGASVTVFRGRAEATSTGANGGFFFEGLAPGVYELEIAAHGSRVERFSAQLDGGAELRLPTVVLRPAGIVTVRVLDAASGLPVNRPRLARASLEAAGFAVRDIVLPPDDVVGEPDGKVTIRGLRVGTHRFVVVVDGYARTRLPDVDVSETDADLIDLGDVMLGVGATLVFQVEDAQGHPVGGLPVRLDHGPALSPLRPTESTTDESGSVAFVHLGPGRYRARFGGDQRPGGTVPLAQRWVELKDEADVRHTVVVGGSTLDVSVRFEDGRPVAGVRVSAAVGDEAIDESTRGLVVQMPDRLINPPFRQAAVGVTDENGQASLTRVPAGVVRLSIALGEPTSWSVPAAVPASGSSAALVIPARSMPVRVSSRATAEAVAGARVRWSTSAGLRVESYADGAGQVVLPGLPDDAGTLEVAAPRFAPRRMHRLLPTGGPIEVELEQGEPGRLFVQAVSARGDGLPDSTVSVLGVSSESRFFTQTLRDGLAELDVPAGLYRVVVSHPGLAPAVLGQLSVAAGREQHVTLELTAGYRIIVTAGEMAGDSTMHLVVATAAGTVIPVTALDDASTTVFASQSEGSVGPVSPGDYLLVFSGGGVVTERRVTVSDRDVAVEVPE